MRTRILALAAAAVLSLSACSAASTVGTTADTPEKKAETTASKFMNLMLGGATADVKAMSQGEMLGYAESSTQSLKSDGCFEWAPDVGSGKKNGLDVEVTGKVNCRGGKSNKLVLTVTEDGKITRLATTG